MDRESIPSGIPESTGVLTAGIDVLEIRYDRLWYWNCLGRSRGALLARSSSFTLFAVSSPP